MELTFDSFDSFSNILSANTSYTLFAAGLALLILLFFTLFLLSLRGRKSRKVVSARGKMSFDPKYLDKLKTVSNDTQELIGQLNETIHEKEQEISHKYERIQQLEEKAQRVELQIEEQNRQARKPFNFGSFLIGLFIGLLIAGGLGGFAVYSRWIELVK